MEENPIQYFTIQSEGGTSLTEAEYNKITQPITPEIQKQLSDHFSQEGLQILQHSNENFEKLFSEIKSSVNAKNIDTFKKYPNINGSKMNGLSNEQIQLALNILERCNSNFDTEDIVGLTIEAIWNNYGDTQKKIDYINSLISLNKDITGLQIIVTKMMEIDEGNTDFRKKYRSFLLSNDKNYQREILRYLGNEPHIGEKTASFLYTNNLNINLDVNTGYHTNTMRLERNKDQIETAKMLTSIPEYQLQLIQTGMNLEEFRGFEQIFKKKENIINIIILLNIKVEIKNIIYLFSHFHINKEVESGKRLSTEERTKMVENLRTVIDDIGVINYYSQGNFSLLEPHKGLTFSELKQKIINENLIDKKNIEQNRAKLEQIRVDMGPHAMSFTLEDIQKYIVNIKNYKDAKEYLAINPNFSVVDIAYLLLDKNWKSEYDTIEKKTEKVREVFEKFPNFSGKEIVLYIVEYENQNKDQDLKSYRAIDPKFDIRTLAYFMNEDNWGVQDNTIEKRVARIKEIQRLNPSLISGDIIMTLYNVMLTLNVTIDELKTVIPDIQTKEQFDGEDLGKINSLRNEYVKHFLTVKQEYPQGKDLRWDTYADLIDRGYSKENIVYILKTYFFDRIISSENKENESNKLNGNLSEIGESSGANGFSLIDFIKENKDRKIAIGETEYSISENIQLVNNLLKYAKNIFPDILENEAQINWNAVIEAFAKDINEYMREGENIDTVFSMIANPYHGEDYNGALSNSPTFQSFLYGNKAKILNYSTGSELGDTLKQSSDIIDILADYLGKNPDKKVALFVAYHGGDTGFTATSKGNLRKEDFEKIQNLSKIYKNLQVFIDSCYSGPKLESSKEGGNIFINSKNYTSSSGFSDVSFLADWKNGIQNADMNKDGTLSGKEAKMSTYMRYHDGIVQDFDFEQYYRNKIRNKSDFLAK